MTAIMELYFRHDVPNEGRAFLFPEAKEMQQKERLPRPYHAGSPPGYMSQTPRPEPPAKKVIEYLNHHPLVEKVNHPLLADHPDHDLYKKFFKNGGGSIFTFEIKGGIKEAHEFIDHLEIFSLLANVADVKSLVIHPATTTHSHLNAQELQEQGIRHHYNNAVSSCRCNSRKTDSCIPARRFDNNRIFL